MQGYRINETEESDDVIGSQRQRSDTYAIQEYTPTYLSQLLQQTDLPNGH